MKARTNTRGSVISLAKKSSKRFIKSVWFFPVILLLIILGLSAFKISGSSIGAEHQLFYGDKAKDPALLSGKVESIRSDEWLVTTQMTIAQSASGYPRVNPNLGDGEDVSLMSNVPYKEWSVIFRPQDLVYFIMPLANAFALNWWLSGFALIVSCYFFVLALAPKRKFLAILLSIALFYSAFIQWWYVFGTLASIFYPLLIATVGIYLCREKVRTRKIALAGALAYLITCFALVLYPPFQVPCGLVLLGFVIGYLAENYKPWGRQLFIKNLLYLAASGVVALAFVGLFLFTRHDVVNTIKHTAYPGVRSISSGYVTFDHFFAPQLGHQFMTQVSTSQYLIDGKSASNQSETSNFLVLAPFLILPSLFLVIREWRKKLPIDWPLLMMCVVFVILILEMFVPQFTPYSKIFFLNQAGGPRSLIGMGLLNIFLFVLLVRNLSKTKFKFDPLFVVPYGLAVLALQLYTGLHSFYAFGTFIGQKQAILVSLPIPLIIYSILKKRFVFAALVYAAFSLFIGFGVNPFYHGLAAFTQDPLSKAVAEVGGNSGKRWVSDGGYTENIALINGKPSLSGVYDYPQPNVWKNIPGVDEFTYNRYAHVGVSISDDPSTPTSLKLMGADSMVLTTSSCSDYLRQQNVGYIVTTAVLKGPCTKQVRKIPYPALVVYIYTIVPQPTGT